MKPHQLLTAKMPLVLTKDLQLAIERWFTERMCTRKLKRSVRHPKCYHLAKNQHPPVTNLKKLMP